MIQRDLQEDLREVAKGFPVIAIMGPRQSGKTTLAQTLFKKHLYISLEDFDKRQEVLEDPRKFLTSHKNDHGIILDEIQHAPEILSYIQTYVDTYKPLGYFIITGSQQFLLNPQVKQSLAGRMAITTLLPLSIHELIRAKLAPATCDEMLLKGGYPRVYTHEVSASRWYNEYVRTYIERDVRNIASILDIGQFARFMRLCAGRVGQLLNITTLSNDCGIDTRTARHWLSLLEATYVIYLLQPHFKNFNKRLIKSPKIMFYDTGLACALLGITTADQLNQHYARGHIFESWVISEIYKKIYNTGSLAKLYFWRDHTGNEIDLIIETGAGLIPVEIKSGMTLNNDFFKNLHYWYDLSGADPASGYLVYGGNENQYRSLGRVLSWRNLDTLTW